MVVKSPDSLGILSEHNFLVHNLGQHTEPWPNGNDNNTSS